MGTILQQTGARPPAGGWRRALAAALVGLAVLAWLVGLVAWVVQAQVVRSDRFADIAVAALRSDAGTTLVTRRLNEQVDRLAAANGVRVPALARTAIDSGTAAALDDHRVEERLKATIARAHRTLLNDPGQPLRIDLETLRGQVVAQVRAVDPRLVRYVPPASAFPDLSIDLDEEYPGVARLPRLVDQLSALPYLAIAMAIVLGGLGLLASADRPATARSAGVAFLVLALVPLIMRFTLPPVARLLAPDGPAKDLASQIAADMLGAWWIGTVLTAVVGGALLFFGAAMRRTTW